MKKTVLYHGGPLVSENFASATFWVTRDHIDRAIEYADDGQLWSMIIDESQECFAEEDDDALFACSSNDSAWDEQTRQIVEAFKKGATVFLTDDGWAINHRGRKVRRIRIV